jgi:two-component system NtrC family sensor kinase
MNNKTNLGALKMSLRIKLIISFVIVIGISGIFSTWVGYRLIHEGIIRLVQDKVRNDLNSARMIYYDNLENVKDIIRLTSVRLFVKESLMNNQVSILKREFDKIKKAEELDVLTITDQSGKVIYRSGNPDRNGESQANDTLVKYVLVNKKVIASTEIIEEEALIKEGESLAAQARIELVPTPKSRAVLENVETSGMMMKAAAPVFDDQRRLIGVIYGGILLNRKYTIVDRIKDTVYKDEVFMNKDIGTATIFQDDIRISTNVRWEDGSRAIGTRVSEEVYKQVLVKGLQWIERAFVVNNWYITAYEPIRNMNGNIIGMLYVGMLEEKFTRMRENTLLIFILITFSGIVMALFVSYLLAGGIIKPVRQLVFASEKLAEGNLDQQVEITSRNEIGELARTFNRMADSIKDRDRQLKEYAETKIMESERLATVGQLAAGVAHELNNPLGGILVYSHLILENLPDNDPNRENIEKIITQTKRSQKIIQGLLYFSRQSAPNIELNNLNKVLESALSLVEDRDLMKNIRLIKNFAIDLPLTLIDVGQIQQVFINIILNAIEAMENAGRLSISTRKSEDDRFIEVEFMDTGCGIAEQNIKKIFEPFFTTKEVGRGTGLGLAISYGIIKRHHGQIFVKSEFKVGTTFTIQLPAGER